MVEALGMRGRGVGSAGREFDILALLWPHCYIPPMDADPAEVAEAIGKAVDRAFLIADVFQEKMTARIAADVAKRATQAPSRSSMRAAAFSEGLRPGDPDPPSPSV